MDKRRCMLIKVCVGYVCECCEPCDGEAFCGVFVATKRGVDGHGYLRLTSPPRAHAPCVREETDHACARAAVHTHRQHRSALSRHHLRLVLRRCDDAVCAPHSSQSLHRENALIRPSNVARSMLSSISPLPVAPNTVPFAMRGESRTIFEVSVVACVALALRPYVEQRVWHQVEALDHNNALRVVEHRSPAGDVAKHECRRFREKQHCELRRTTREATPVRGTAQSPRS